MFGKWWRFERERGVPATLAIPSEGEVDLLSVEAQASVRVAHQPVAAATVVPAERVRPELVWGALVPQVLPQLLVLLELVVAERPQRRQPRARPRLREWQPRNPPSLAALARIKYNQYH